MPSKQKQTIYGTFDKSSFDSKPDEAMSLPGVGASTYFKDFIKIGKFALKETLQAQTHPEEKLMLIGLRQK